MLWGEPVVAVFRGDRLESMHAVAACLSDDFGTVTAELGAIDEPVFLRSCVKPFIAATVVASGTADRLGFSESEIALISASHGGEPGHVEAARSILAKAGIPESALQCGAHFPSNEAAANELRQSGEPPAPIHNNCSGKHAGLLALAKSIGAPLDGYLDPSHPAQQAWLATCARLFGLSRETLVLAVDGCGIPTIAVSLRSAALGFARFATLRGLDDLDGIALARVKAAIRADGWFVGGTGTFDTRLIEVAGDAVVGKGGAEGVHCDALGTAGLGLAVKVIDGARRAVPVATLALLEAAGALSRSAMRDLASFAAPQLHNAAGTPIGKIAARLPPSLKIRRS